MRHAVGPRESLSVVALAAIAGLMLIAMAGCAATAEAQTLRSVFAGAADNGGLGYVSPTFQVGAQVEQRWEQFELGAKFDISSSRKLNFNEGWSATTSAGTLWFFSRPVFATGGIRFGYTRTPEYDKWALRPYLGAGFDVPVGSVGELRFSGTCVFRGTDTANDLHGLDFSARYRATGGRWYVTAYGGAWNFVSGGYEYARSNYGLTVGKEF